MKLEISRSFNGKKNVRHEIKNSNENVIFEGVCYKEGLFLILEGRLTGKAKVVCDSSGEEFFDSIDETLTVKFINGFYDGFDKKYDIIELDSDSVDLEMFLTDEIEGFRLGFHRKDETN